ncbi:TolC family protein [Nitratireductor kimnyeongensis]|uniref:Protein CyaE n=1 Tax=Nitratireductor kimnyeongensis TaxID=430679 RepID=A0ABW0TDS8_9HYPH|nr:TolC family protein [Nitratireductor kimnyeongensis]QZZ36941.1 TolC family protein [Nitratireductor kimnyeongensis]
MKVCLAAGMGFGLSLSRKNIGSRIFTLTLIHTICILTSACVSEYIEPEADTPEQSYSVGGKNGDYSIPPDQEAASSVSELTEKATAFSTDHIKHGYAYSLPELIDIGQRLNPATRVAWEQARQAAAAVGMVEATFLPVITANIIAGQQRVVTPVPKLTGGTDHVGTTINGVVPNIALQWLIFDFGERQAWRTAAEQNAHAANINFNGSHQVLIYNISRAYYQYGATKNNLAIAQQTLANSRRLMDVANTRYKNGVGTSIETAQAKQLVAQSRFRLVQAEDALRDAYHDLIGSVGLPATTNIKISDESARRLPRPRALPTEELVKAALAQRPDVLASYAAIKASEANVRATDAAFMPKVYLGAMASANSGSIQTGNLPGLGLQNTSTGILVGATVPIYDGGLRTNQRRQAEAGVRAAEAAHEQTRSAAIREIVIASDTLRSALASYSAANELVEAAGVTYDASFDAFKNGVVPITDVIAADSGLLDAKQAKAEAHAASLIAASTLAFSLGNMTSRNSPQTAIR